MLFGPVAHGRENRYKRLACRRQGVLDGYWDRCFDAPGDEAVPLETPQCLRQHLLRDAGDLATQLAEAVRAFCENSDDERRPSVADAMEGATRGAVRVVHVEERLSQS